MRVVLANLNADNGDSATLDMTLLLAMPGGAHVRAIYAPEEPRLLATMASPEAASVIGSVIRAAEDERAAAVARARATWSDWRRRSGLDESAAAGGARPTTEFVEIVDDGVSGLGRAGRYADLVVTCRGAAPSVAACEAVLFTSGRPVLVLPEGITPPATTLDTIAIAWDDRAEASRAVAASLPLLRRARRVDLLHCAGSGAAAALAPVADFLRRHGIDPQATTLPPADTPPGETLTAAAEARGAGLIVMGAYGHGRLRELVFGGMTRHMLTRGRLPTLMMH